MRLPFGGGSSTCRLCGGKFGLVGAAARSWRFEGVCNKCGKEAAPRCERFRATIEREIQIGNPTPDQLSARLAALARSLGVDLGLALEYSRELSISLLRRALTFMVSDGVLDDRSEALFHGYRRAFGIAEAQIPQLMAEVSHFAFLRELGKGNLPRIVCSAMLPTTEIPHMEVGATYVRYLKSGLRLHAGRLILTNQRILFTHTDKPFEVGLAKVIGIHFGSPDNIVLQLTRQSGGGLYRSPQAFYFVEVVRAAMNVFHRRVVVAQAGTRMIPQHMKVAVYQRCGGRCVQCGAADYLEFDHVIPFSMGGATSENNLQLLCRKCNLAKGARI